MHASGLSVNMERILVTGGCGFIGSHLCEALLERGNSVRVLDDLSSGHRENLASLGNRVELLVGDVRDPAVVTEALRDVAGVFHEAALVSVFDSVERPGDCHDINATGTLNVLQAARAEGVRRIVFAGTAAAYGNNPVLPKHEGMVPEPASPYAASKIAGEHLLRVFSHLYGLETVTLRYFNVYGPRQNPASPYSGVISKFLSDLKAERAPTIFGDGLQSRDFVFVKDVVQANLQAMFGREPGNGSVYNIASGRTATLLDLCDTLGRLAQQPFTPQHRDPRAGDIRHSAADISKAQHALDYNPHYDLETGLRELLETEMDPANT